MDGVVLSFNRKHGYGFIRPLIGAGPNCPAIFCHATALPRGVNSLQEGSRVSFDVVEGWRGPQCARVRLHTLSGDALTGRDARSARPVGSAGNGAAR